MGGLWNALCNLSLLSTAMWPSSSPEHREARELVARYNLLCFQLLFVEAQVWAGAAHVLANCVSHTRAYHFDLPLGPHYTLGHHHTHTHT